MSDTNDAEFGSGAGDESFDGIEAGSGAGTGEQVEISGSVSDDENTENGRNSPLTHHRGIFQIKSKKLFRSLIGTNDAEQLELKPSFNVDLTTHRRKGKEISYKFLTPMAFHSFLLENKSIKEIKNFTNAFLKNYADFLQKIFVIPYS